jgi:DNA polymerase III subunit epsilon
VIRIPFRGRSSAATAYLRTNRPPPSTPWRQAAFTAVDLELTGLDPRHDEIISFAAVPIEGGRVLVGDTHSAIVRPERMPSAETIRIHGLRPVDLADAAPVTEVRELILEALSGRIVVAHPARVERAFLSVALKGAGVRLAEPVLCTATLVGEVLPSDRIGVGRGEIPLSEAAHALSLPVHAPHTADGDALTTAQLFIAVVARLDRREPQTVGSLARLSRGRTAAVGR